MQRSRNSMSSPPEIAIRDEIKSEDLEALFLGHTLDCLVVRNFCEAGLCAKLSKYFLNHKDIVWYLNDEVADRDVKVDGKTEYRSLGVQRVGPAFNTTYNDDEDNTQFKKYLREKDIFWRDLRNFLGDQTSPMERLRLDLDELFVNRVNIANVKGKKAFSGISRITRAENSVPGEEPHIDAVPKDIELTNQFAANVYLEMPDCEGGELRMWNTDPFILQDVPAFCMGDYNVGDANHCSYKPADGDLVLFCTRRPHAVGRFDKGVRVSMQSFVGLTEDEDLVLWT